MDRVLSSMQHQTIMKAQFIGIVELDKHDLDASDLLDAILDICGEKWNSLRHSNNGISWHDRCVTFVCCAGNDLLVATANPHEAPAINKNVTKVQTLHLRPSKVSSLSAAETAPLHEYEVYCVADGVDMLKRKNYAVITDFVIGTLTAFMKQIPSPHDILEPQYFRVNPLYVRGEGDRFVAMSRDDWHALSSRYVDCQFGIRRLGANSTIFNRYLGSTWGGANIAVLIGGESGSGKTMEMLCGHCERSHLAVYMRFSPEVLAKTHLREVNDIVTNDAIDRTGVWGAREKRNDAFVRLVAAVVQSAINTSCPAMVDALRNHHTGKRFNVRLCFDDMGDNLAFVRAYCAFDPPSLRDMLHWGPRVEIFIVAAGTGIGSVMQPAGSENTFYHLTRLTSAGFPDIWTGLYWRMRTHLLFDHHPSRVCRSKDNVGPLATLQREVTAVRDSWCDDRSQRDEKLLQRSATLAGLLKAHTADINAIPDDPDHLRKMNATSTLLAQESLFASIESDAACAVALSNPRMAALFVSVVQEVADDQTILGLSVLPSGTSIQRTVLQRVAVLYKSLSGLKGATPEETSALLIESLRYALFDGYVGARFTATTLVSGRGVLIDNADYKREVPAGYEVACDVDGKELRSTYTACYPKTLGRYGITPAMVVVLSTLMTEAFEESFSNIGDGFERDMTTFLYLTVQVFHGRPVRELVDFIVGPSAVIGKTAQEILKGDAKVEFCSLTLRFGGLCSKANTSAVPSNVNDGEVDAASPGTPRKAEEGDVAASTALLVKELRCNKSRGAWIEIRPPGLHAPDVVLHIPDVITLPIWFKDVEDIASVGSLGHQSLCDLDAPVIPVVYVSQARTLSSDAMSWDDLNAIGAHCIIAGGIGEHSSKIPPLLVSPDAHYRTERLHRVRSSMMLFESRHKASTTAVELVVGTAPLVSRE
ncbi:Hypothetical protein, putative [Bodo saltans]|uniref:Uncharacterized protein n=1 Tax=Bodo saltans TaxID=75058 RepID=A0A0S4J6A9_BODSA|nr:Hypothetical protein, putative [Bodo saltans]|eukprot:CUG85993.1 Hypothetical protein, putative [Bodo saltans]